jgi:hypothetical protein
LPRKSWSVVIILVLAGGVITAINQAETAAEEESPREARPMKAEAAATRRPPSGVKTIWDYRKVLGLTDQQIKQMKAILAKFQTDVLESQKQLLAAEEQLQRMIEDDAPMDQIKTKLKSIASLQADIRAEDISTSRKVNAAMEPEQLEKWREIQRLSRPQVSR